jgi:hypothetical protein
VTIGTGKNTRASIFDKLNDDSNMTPGRTASTNEKLNNSQMETESKNKREKKVFKRELEIEVEDPNDTSLRESRSDFSSHNLNVSKHKYMDINMQNNAY